MAWFFGIFHSIAAICASDETRGETFARFWNFYICRCISRVATAQGKQGIWLCYKFYFLNCLNCLINCTLLNCYNVARKLRWSLKEFNLS